MPQEKLLKIMVLKSFKIKESDKKLISDKRGNQLESEKRPEQNSFDYSRVIVKKPWGYEYVVYRNLNHLSVTLLSIDYNKTTSLHCHPQKKKWLYTC